MTEKYAIINQVAGHLTNVVLWDGDTATWQPPDGTSAVRLADIDLSSLPATPAAETAHVTVEEHLKSVGLSGDRQPTLLYLRQSLAAAGKTCAELDAVESYLQQLLAMFAADQAPRNDWPKPTISFESAVQAAMNALNS